MSILRLKACGRCGGDLKADDHDWQCLQCGHYYYGDLGLYRETASQAPVATGTAPARRPEASTWATSRRVARLARTADHDKTVASSRATRTSRHGIIQRQLKNQEALSG